MKVKITIFVIFFVFIVLFSMKCWSSDWKFIAKEPDGCELFYDTQSVSCRQGITSVWIKHVLSDKGKKSIIINCPQTPGIEKINSINTRHELDCQKNTERVKDWIYFASDGDVILSGSDLNTKFCDCASENIFYKLLEIICKKKGAEG